MDKGNKMTTLYGAYQRRLADLGYDYSPTGITSLKNALFSGQAYPSNMYENPQGIYGQDPIAAAGARFKTPNELGFYPGGSSMASMQNIDSADMNPQVLPEAAPQRTLGLLGDMFGGASALDEYMTPEQKAQLQNQGAMAAAMQLLAASGPSRTPVGLGQALGQAYGAGQQGYTAAQQNLLQSMSMKQKMDEAKAAKGMQANVSTFLAQKAPEGVDAKEFKAQQYMKLADLYAATNPDQANKFFDMAQKLMPAKESTPDDIKKLQALNLPVTMENLQSLKQEATPAEVRLLQATNTPVTLENVMKIRQSGAAGGTNVSVNTGDKTRAVEINKDIVAQMGTMTEQARSANETLMNVDRILPALSGAITGPLADYRTTLTRVGQQFGIVGKDANEVLAKTQTLVQGLAQQELTAAGQMKGQGAITEPERALLRRAAVGDQNMSAAELQTALQTAQKVAQYRIGQHQQYLNKFSALPGAEQYVPFYSVTPYQATGGGNAMQSAIDAELAKRAQQQRGGGMR
jgi:hypothetical protein